MSYNKQEPFFEFLLWSHHFKIEWNKQILKFKNKKIKDSYNIHIKRYDQFYLLNKTHDITKIGELLYISRYIEKIKLRKIDERRLE